MNRWTGGNWVHWRIPAEIVFYGFGYIMTPEQIKNRIVEAVARNGRLLKGYRIVLFGSRASGRARPRSDFDVGVIGDTPIPLTTFFLIGAALDNVETLHRIDWVDLNRASEAFRNEAMKKIEVLYET